MTKRVLIINKESIFEGTGGEDLIFHVGKVLSENGWEVHYLTPRPRSLKKQLKLHPNMKLHYIEKTYKNSLFLRGLIYMFLTPIRYKELDKKFNYEFIIDHVSPIPVFLIHLRKSSKKIMFIEDLFGIDAFSCKNNFFMALLSFLFKLILPLISSRNILCESRGTKNKIRKKCKNSNILIISPPIDISNIPYSPSPKSRIILSLCLLSKRKGVEYLIRAARYIDKKCQILIAGEGPQYERLLRLNKKVGSRNIHFLGFVSEREKRELFKKASIYILPTLHEGLGHSNLEAMAFGKAVISTDIPGVSDYLVNNYNGILVPPKSPKEIANAINNLLGNYDRIKILGENARKTAEEYNYTRFKKSVMSAFSKLGSYLNSP